MIQRPANDETQPLRTTLDNGAVLLSRPTPDAYGVAVGVMVCTGTRDEAPALGGISHLLEHMVFKGTSRRSAFELARDMEAIGAQLDAYTTKEHTGYTLMVVPEQLDVALGILSEMLLDSTFPPDQLELEKQVVIEEILSSEDNPEDHIHELFTERLLADHPLARPILGTQETVMGIGTDDLKSWVEQTHRGGNVILSTAGNVGAREMDLIARAFNFPAGNGQRGAEAPAVARPALQLHEKDLAQQYVELGIPTVGAGEPLRFAVSVVASIMGGGMSSRLFQRIREEEGLAYSIYTWTEFNRDTGILSTSFSASPENAQRALDLTMVEYERLRSGDLPTAELDSNKAQLAASVVMGLEGSMGQMSRFARNQMYYGRFMPVEEILETIEAVTRDDVVAAAQLLAPDLQTVVGYGPCMDLTLQGRSI